MYCWKTSLLLEAPREKVWETLADFENSHTWNPSGGKASFETEGPVGQGTRLRVNRGGKSSLITVEEWGPPRLLRLFLTQGKTTGSSRFYLTHALNGNTQLEHSFELDPPLYLEPFVFFAALDNKKTLKALKRWVEKKS